MLSNSTTSKKEDKLIDTLSTKEAPPLYDLHSSIHDLPKALHFGVPALTPGSRTAYTTHIYPAPYYDTSYLTCKVVGSNGFRSFIIQESGGNDIFKFSHRPISPIERNMTWIIHDQRRNAVVSASSPPRKQLFRLAASPSATTEYTMKVFDDPFNGTGFRGEFINPYKVGYKYEWVAKEGNKHIYILGRHQDAVITRKEESSEREQIAEFAYTSNNATLQLLTEKGGIDKDTMIWSSLEECAFIVGTAVAMSLEELCSHSELEAKLGEGAMVAVITACEIM